MISSHINILCGLFFVTILDKINIIENTSLELKEWPEDSNKTKTADFPFDLFQVVTDAGNVFSKVVSKMISKKRILGLDNWYW